MTSREHQERHQRLVSTVAREIAEHVGHEQPTTRDRILADRLIHVIKSHAAVEWQMVIDKALAEGTMVLPNAHH